MAKEQSADGTGVSVVGSEGDWSVTWSGCLAGDTVDVDIAIHFMSVARPSPLRSRCPLVPRSSLCSPCGASCSGSALGRSPARPPAWSHP